MTDAPANDNDPIQVRRGGEPDSDGAAGTTGLPGDGAPGAPAPSPAGESPEAIATIWRELDPASRARLLGYAESLRDDQRTA